MKSLKIKIIVFAVLAAMLVPALIGCGSSSKSPSTDNPTPASGQTPSPAPADNSSTDVRPEMFDQDEYVLYQNVFYSDFGKECDGQSVRKEGIFAVLKDAYNNRTRYYVWGYYDGTKCCDWQWEFVPKDGEELPAAGSLVTVTGTFKSDDNALDGYWIANAHAETKKAYTGPSAEVDMLSMSCTLERVQMYNIIAHPEEFQDLEFFAYGRIAGIDSLQDPYYDGSWNIKIAWDGDLSGIGAIVEVSGTIGNGVLNVGSMKDM